MLITKYLTFYYYQEFVGQVKNGLQDILDRSSLFSNWLAIFNEAN